MLSIVLNLTQMTGLNLSIGLIVSPSLHAGYDSELWLFGDGCLANNGLIYYVNLAAIDIMRSGVCGASAPACAAGRSKPYLCNPNITKLTAEHKSKTHPKLEHKPKARAQGK